MVMDATPSPQNVGREFVRQYYTLLNKAPNHLHRFYNNNSSFIHEGFDGHNREATLVVGQKNIHSKIQQLNFRDCHAKISQVDAQATLGNGVVVQVTGELSNDGQPMRRFTQTFVLAAQSPKNYYVHNDIFRYQDLYIEDDVESGEVRSENDDESAANADSTKILNSTSVAPASGTVSATAPNAITSSEQQTQALSSTLTSVAGAPAPQQIYYTMPIPQAVVTPFNSGVASVTAVAPASGVSPTVSTQIISTQPQQGASATAGQVNGVHEELIQTIQQSASAQIAPAVPAAAVLAATAVVAGVSQVNATQQVLLSQQNSNLVPTGPSSLVATPSVSAQGIVSSTQLQNQNLQNSTVSNVSVASVVSSKQQSSLSNEEKEHTKKDIEKHENSSNEIEQNKKEESKSNETEKYDTYKPTTNQIEVKTYANLFKPGGFNNSGFVPLPQPPHQINSQIYSKSAENQRNESSTGQSTGALPQRSNTRQSKDYMDRRTSNVNSFGDSHQLFFGNVPHCATEEDLKVLFSKFGTVVDLRILSKPGQKLPGQRNTQNYGFITYENLEDVQNCLANCPLYFPAENGQKLNIEEKKTRPRNEMPNRQQNNISNSGNLGGSQRSGGGGGGGQSNRSHSNTGNMMRSGNSGGQRMSGGGSGSGGGGFNRSDNRGPPQNRNSSGNTNQNSSGSGGGGGGNYGRR